MSMYTKNLGERMTLRLTEEQRHFLLEMAEATGLGPSEYVRMMLNSAIYAWKKAQAVQDATDEALTAYMSQEMEKAKGGRDRHENGKANKHDIV